MGNRTPFLLPQVFGPYVKRYLAKAPSYEPMKQNEYSQYSIEGNKYRPEPEPINPKPIA